MLKSISARISILIHAWFTIAWYLWQFHCSFLSTKASLGKALWVGSMSYSLIWLIDDCVRISISFVYLFYQRFPSITNYVKCVNWHRLIFSMPFMPLCIINLRASVRLVMSLSCIIWNASLLNTLTSPFWVHSVVLLRRLMWGSCGLHTELLIWFRKNQSTANLIDSTRVDGSIVGILAIVLLVRPIPSFHWRLVLRCNLGCCD